MIVIMERELKEATNEYDDEEIEPIMIVLYMCTYLCYFSLTQLENIWLWRNLGSS